jgi:hypothetical protein
VVSGGDKGSGADRVGLRVWPSTTACVDCCEVSELWDGCDIRSSGPDWVGGRAASVRKGERKGFVRLELAGSSLRRFKGCMLNRQVKVNDGSQKMFGSLDFMSSCRLQREKCGG